MVKSKYKSRKTIIGDVIFDSKKEAHRWRELCLQEDAGLIENLQRQKKYVLIPAQREPDAVGKRGGVKKGKLLERECAYYADFVYTIAETGETVVEDSKGRRTKDYIIKRKLMLWVHGIRVKET
jgi:hypothetical protein